MPKLANKDSKRYIDNPWLKTPNPLAEYLIPTNEFIINPDTPTKTWATIVNMESLTNLLLKNSFIDNTAKNLCFNFFNFYY